MNNEKEKAPINKVEGAESKVAIMNEIMFNILKAATPMLQVLHAELQKTKAELEKLKTANSSQKSE